MAAGDGVTRVSVGRSGDDRDLFPSLRELPLLPGRAAQSLPGAALDRLRRRRRVRALRRRPRAQRPPAPGQPELPGSSAQRAARLRRPRRAGAAKSDARRRRGRGRAGSDRPAHVAGGARRRRRGDRLGHGGRPSPPCNWRRSWGRRAWSTSATRTRSPSCGISPGAGAPISSSSAPARDRRPSPCSTTRVAAGNMPRSGSLAKPVAWDLDQVCMKELRVTGSNASVPSAWRTALRLLARRQRADRAADLRRLSVGELGRCLRSLRGTGRGKAAARPRELKSGKVWLDLDPGVLGLDSTPPETNAGVYAGD